VLDTGEDVGMHVLQGEEDWVWQFSKEPRVGDEDKGRQEDEWARWGNTKGEKTIDDKKPPSSYKTSTSPASNDDLFCTEETRAAPAAPPNIHCPICPCHFHLRYIGAII
jgi:hypothetical protein